MAGIEDGLYSYGIEDRLYSYGIEDGLYSYGIEDGSRRRDATPCSIGAQPPRPSPSACSEMSKTEVSKTEMAKIEMSKENALGGEALVDIASVGRVVDHRSMLPLVEPR